MKGMQKRYKLFTLLAAMVWVGTARAQEAGNLYIQSENNQAFYAQWNGNVYPSSTNGMLVIPKVPRGEQVIQIGFPLQQYPEYSFSLIMGERPMGFALKLAINNTWSLFDMVKLTQIQGTLSSVVQKKAETKVEDMGIKPEINKVPDTRTEDTIARQPITPAQLALAATIQKIYDKAGNYGTDQVYVVNNDGKMDTVAIFIPVLSEVNTKTMAMGKGTGRMPVNPDTMSQAVIWQRPLPTSPKSSK